MNVLLQLNTITSNFNDGIVILADGIPGQRTDRQQQQQYSDG